MTQTQKESLKDSPEQETTEMVDSGIEALENQIEQLIKSLKEIFPKIPIAAIENEDLSVENKSNNVDLLLKQRIEELYASNMSVSTIAEKLSKEFNRKITSEFIFSSIEKSVPEYDQVQGRHLNKIYPLLCIDKCEYTGYSDRYGSTGYTLFSIIAVNKNGEKECLGFWSCKKKNQVFWNDLMTELRNRGIEDILVILSEESQELRKALKSMFPETILFPSPGHLISKVSRFVNQAHTKEIIQSLKAIWLSESQQEGNELMERFCNKWVSTYPLLVDYITKSWSSDSMCLAFGDQILRQFIFNPSPVFKFSRTISSAFIHKEIMPSQVAACKLACAATHSLRKKWTVKVFRWCFVCQSLGKVFENRFQLFD